MTTTRTLEMFWQTWQRHREFLLKQSLRLTAGNRADAEDALGEVLKKAAEYFVHFDAIKLENERAWLGRLLYNACMDGHRTRRRLADQGYPREGEEEEYQESCPSLEDRLVAVQRIRELRQHMRELPTSLSEPLTMRFDDQLSYDEIAVRLNLTAVNARKRVQLACAALRTRLRNSPEVG